MLLRKTSSTASLEYNKEGRTHDFIFFGYCLFNVWFGFWSDENAGRKTQNQSRTEPPAYRIERSLKTGGEDETMKYCIKVLTDDGTYAVADSDFYEAASPLEALHQFAEVRKNDLLVTNLEIVNDDPDNFILFVEGYVENRMEQRFDVVGDEFEYIAVEEK